MGTDIYLSWKGQTKKEKEKQSTGFDIGSGDVGYLRASIGMVRENAFLKAIFEEDYWKGKELRYEFKKENYFEIQKLGFLYLLTLLNNKEKSDNEDNLLNPLLTLLEQFKDKGFKVKVSNNLNFRMAILWLNSLFDFYELGLKKEEEGKEPKIYISW